jgi:hypothetical protein
VSPRSEIWIWEEDPPANHIVTRKKADNVWENLRFLFRTKIMALQQGRRSNQHGDAGRASAPAPRIAAKFPQQTHAHKGVWRQNDFARGPSGGPKPFFASPCERDPFFIASWKLSLRTSFPFVVKQLMRCWSVSRLDVFSPSCVAIVVLMVT